MSETPDNIRRKADDLARGRASSGEIYRFLHRVAAQIEGAGKENGGERECLKRHGIEY